MYVVADHVTGALLLIPESPFDLQASMDGASDVDVIVSVCGVNTMSF